MTAMGITRCLLQTVPFSIVNEIDVGVLACWRATSAKSPVEKHRELLIDPRRAFKAIMVNDKVSVPFCGSVLVFGYWVIV